MKNKKILALVMVPVLAGITIIGANYVSAHGMFGGFGGIGLNSGLTADEMATRHQQMFQEEANFLGLSVDDVKAAWAAGKTMQDLAKEKGISEDQLQQKMKDARTAQMKTQLQTLVDKGVITQAQADTRLNFMSTMMQNGKGKKGRGHMGFDF